MIDDSRTGLDVNALSSSQRGAAWFCGCKDTFFFVCSFDIPKMSYFCIGSLAEFCRRYLSN